MTIESSVAHHQFSVADFLDHYSKQLESDFTPFEVIDPKGEKIIQLMTYHQAAGLIKSFAEMLFHPEFTANALRNDVEVISEKIGFIPDNLNEELKSVAGLCHHVALTAFDKNEEISSEQSTKVANAFENLAKTYRLRSKNLGLTVRLQQLYEATPLLIKCSEAFIRHISSFNSRLPFFIEQMPMKPSLKIGFSSIILTCKEFLFPESLCTRVVKNEMDAGYTLPDLTFLSIEDAQREVAKSLLSLALSLNSESRKLSDEECMKVRSILNRMVAKLKQSKFLPPMREKLDSFQCQLPEGCEYQSYKSLAKYPKGLMVCMQEFAVYFNKMIARLPEVSIVDASAALRQKSL